MAEFDVAKVRKAVVASVGGAVLVLGGFGLDQFADAGDEVIALFDAAVAVALAVGVYKVRNGAKPGPR